MASLSELVKELREKTGAGILDCQKALTENGNSIDKAIDYLRQKGLAAAQKKAGRETNQGLILYPCRWKDRCAHRSQL